MTPPSVPAAAQRRGPPPGAILVAPLDVAFALTLFAWPAANLAPRDLPVGVAGSGPVARQIEGRLEQRRGAFDVHRYRDAAQARAAIQDRDVYGAFVPAGGNIEVLTASAASAVVAQLLHEAAGRGAQVRDVRGGTGAGSSPRARLHAVGWRLQPHAARSNCLRPSQRALPAGARGRSRLRRFRSGTRRRSRLAG